MSKKKVTLEHSVFGQCVVKEAYYTASSGSAYFRVVCEAGTKQLLAAAQYWNSTAAELRNVFDAFSAKALAAEKDKRAAERKKDIYAAKKLATDKRVRALFAADDEIKEVEMEITNGTRYEQRPDEDYAEANF